MGAQIVGALMLVAGTVMLLFGFSYVNSPQYRVMSVVNDFTGASDPTGNVAMVIGGIVAVVGLVTLIVGMSKKKKV